MNVVILYKPDSEQAREVEDYIREFGRRNPAMKVEGIDADNLEGSNMGKLYDITSYPAVMVVQSDGSLSRLWQDVNLPLIDEVMSYAME